MALVTHLQQHWQQGDQAEAATMERTTIHWAPKLTRAIVLFVGPLNQDIIWTWLPASGPQLLPRHFTWGQALLVPAWGSLHHAPAHSSIPAPPLALALTKGPSQCTHLPSRAIPGSAWVLLGPPHLQQLPPLPLLHCSSCLSLTCLPTRYHMRWPIGWKVAGSWSRSPIHWSKSHSTAASPLPGWMYVMPSVHHHKCCHYPVLPDAQSGTAGAGRRGATWGG